jgi:sn-glycerol 3-phosphate transport system permease protein
MKVKNRQPLSRDDTRGVVFPQHKILPFLLILGPVAIVALFFIYPTLSSLRLSLFTVGRFGQEVWVGLDNFASIFLESKYRSSLLLSILFSSAVTLIGLLLALGIGTLLSQRLKGIGAFRVFLTWTYAISPTIMATIWLLFMDPATGLLPYVVKEVTGLQVHWTASSGWALVVITLTAIWAKLGYNTLFFLIALRRVSTELLDAANIDGASTWTTFWKIKFPLISPVTFFLLIMNTLFSLYWVFPIIDIMTHGGPGRSTSLLIYTLFVEGFRNGRAGLASALSIVIFSLVAIITIVQFKMAGRKVFYQ